MGEVIDKDICKGQRYTKDTNRKNLTKLIRHRKNGGQKNKYAILYNTSMYTIIYILSYIGYNTKTILI